MSRPRSPIMLTSKSWPPCSRTWRGSAGRPRTRTGRGLAARSGWCDVAGATLDTGALIAIERGSRRMQALLDEAAAAGAELAVPAGALAQAWRGTPRQARLSRFLRLPRVELVA